DGDKVTIDDVVKALNHRGFGPLMMAPALLVILPTGAIPGVPAVAGITLCLVSAQIVFGRHYPWMPKRLKNFSLKRSKLVSAIERARPYTKRIDRYVRPRYKIFAHSLMQRLVATICFVLGIIMTLAGFIPFLPAAIGVPVL